MGYYKVSIWYPLILAEVCVLVSWILGFLLWGAKKEQQRLRARITALQQGHKATPTRPTAHADLPANIDAVTTITADDVAGTAGEETPAADGVQQAQDATRTSPLSAAPPETLETARAANARLTQELATQQQRMGELRAREKAKNRECQQLKDELATATRNLAQQESTFHELQATHDDLSKEYQRLFETFQK